MRFALGCHCWLLLITLLFVFLLFFQFFGQQSLRPSTCRPLQPRIELLTDEDERRYEAWKHEQVKRNQRVKKFCEKETSWKETWLSNPNLHPLMFQYNKDYSLMGCLQPKVFPSSVLKINNVSLRFRSRQPRGTNISIVWSLRQFEKNLNHIQERNKRISCRRLSIPILKISHQLPSPSRWSGILLRGLSPLTRIRSLEK